MPFPESERVLYDHNTLEEVICQVRFAPILKIDTEIPAAFQDGVRSFVPMYRRAQATVNLPPGIPIEIAQAVASASPPVHEFFTPDEQWKVGLARDFVALSTRAYENWRHFRERFAVVARFLRETYGPALLMRTGLRYRNRINRAALGLADASWGDLIEPRFAGELADSAVGSSVVHILRELVISLSGNVGQVRIVHGLERLADDTETYVIDGDFFTDTHLSTEGVIDVLDEFNRKAGRLYRWYATDRLHNAMGPRPSPH